jgi:hypothetical protein
VGKQSWFASCDACQEPPRLPVAAVQPLVFPHRPPHQMIVEVSEDPTNAETRKRP